MTLACNDFLRIKSELNAVLLKTGVLDELLDHFLNCGVISYMDIDKFNLNVIDFNLPILRWLEQRLNACENNWYAYCLLDGLFLSVVEHNNVLANLILKLYR